MGLSTVIQWTHEKGGLGASQAVMVTGVGWTHCGYLEGAFYILLYPALARRMHMLLVVPFQG